MTAIEQVERKIGENSSTLAWSAALVRTLGNPEEWEYTGEVSEGKTFCACGHPIMECYHIRNTRTQEQQIVGSTCINYFAGAGAIYAQLTVAVDAMQRKLAEAKKAAKKAADAEKVAQARAAYESRYDTLKARFLAYREMDQLAPRALWEAMASYYRVHRNAPTYQRACDYLKWYDKQTKALAHL